MGFLSGFMGLFNSQNEDAVVKSVEYKGFKIAIKPRNVNSQFGVGAIITKEVGNDIKEHLFIRADTLPSIDSCTEVTLNKARMTIDQLGDRIFG